MGTDIIGWFRYSREQSKQGLRYESIPALPPTPPPAGARQHRSAQGRTRGGQDAFSCCDGQPGDARRSCTHFRPMPPLEHTSEHHISHRFYDVKRMFPLFRFFFTDTPADPISRAVSTLPNPCLPQKTADTAVLEHSSIN